MLQNQGESAKHVSFVTFIEISNVFVFFKSKKKRRKIYGKKKKEGKLLAQLYSRIDNNNNKNSCKMYIVVVKISDKKILENKIDVS